MRSQRELGKRWVAGTHDSEHTKNAHRTIPAALSLHPPTSTGNRLPDTLLLGVPHRPEQVQVSRAESERSFSVTGFAD
jgi:hypothetical protein